MGIILSIITGIFILINIVVWSLVAVLSFIWLCSKLTTDEMVDKIKSKKKVKQWQVGTE